MTSQILLFGTSLMAWAGPAFGPCVIGEVGNFWPTNDTTIKVLRASARASVETGAAVLIHPGFHPDSPPHILDTLLEGGAEPGRNQSWDT